MAPFPVFEVSDASHAKARGTMIPMSARGDSGADRYRRAGLALGGGAQINDDTPASGWRHPLAGMSRRDTASALLALAVSMGAAAHAAEPEIWRFQCLGGETLGAEICTTEVSTSDRDREFVIYFVHSQSGKIPLVVAGEDEPFAATVVKVDDKEPVSADECETGACYFGLEKSAVLLKQFRKGRSARVTVTTEGAEIILDKTITLRGFSAAFAEAGS
ncbi:MAG: hypothetical protein ACE5GS_16525 [Kiloniellaceae bacterium]